MRKFYLFLPTLAALALGCSDDKKTNEFPPPSEGPALTVKVVSVERTKVSFELTTDQAVDYAYVILPSDQQAPASAEALFADGAKTGMFDRTTVTIDDQSVSGNNAYTLYAAARTINPFVYSQVATASVDTHFDYTEAITLDAVTRNSFTYHIKPESEGEYRHICCRKSDYDWLVAYLGINPAMYVGTFGFRSDEEQSFIFEDAYVDESDNPVYIYSGTEYMIIYGMADPTSSYKVLSAETLVFSTVKADEAPYSIGIKVDNVTSIAADVTITPEEGIERYRMMAATTADYDGYWIEGESVVRSAIIGDPSDHSQEYTETKTICVAGLKPDTEYTVGVVGFDREDREKVAFYKFATTQPTGPAPTIAIDPQPVEEPWHEVSLNVKVQHALNMWVCLETKAKYDEVLDQPGFSGTLGDIIHNNGIQLTPEQLQKALTEGILCQSDELNPYTEYMYGFYAVNEELVTTTETYVFRTEAAPTVDLRMQLVGDYEAAITDLDGQPHTFRVTVSDGPNEALKTEYGLKNQLVMLGFEPCGIPYRSPQELLDNGWAATEEEANANYGPKIILEVKQDNTVVTGAVNPNTSELDYYMADFNGSRLHFQGYATTETGRVTSSPVSFPIEVSEDLNTLAIKPYVNDSYQGLLTYYPGVYAGESPWWGGTDRFRGGSEMVLTRVPESDAPAGAVKCRPVGSFSLPSRVSVDLSDNSSDESPRMRMMRSYAAHNEAIDR